MRSASVALIAFAVWVMLAGHLFGQADPTPLPALQQAPAPPPSPTTVVAVLSSLGAVFTALSAFLGPVIKDGWAFLKFRLAEKRRILLIDRKTPDLVAYARMAKLRYPDLPDPPIVPPDALADLDDATEVNR